MSAPTTASPGGDVVEQFAALVSSGLKPIEARAAMGLTNGRGARILAVAKRRGLVSNADFNWFRKSKSDAATKLRDAVADLVADGMSLVDAAKHLGITRSRIDKHWARIRRDLGWQAV